MFGWFKRKPAPEGPVQFEGAVEVDRPPADVYALLDWADPRNAKRDLGNRIEPIEGEPDRFRLIMTDMPEHTFDMTVTKALPSKAYTFSTDVRPRVGRLEHDEEQYSLEPLGEDRCTLKLTTIATFQRGMSMKQFEHELMVMSVACQRALLKLKVHAEQGVEGVKALDAAFYG